MRVYRTANNIFPGDMIISDQDLLHVKERVFFSHSIAFTVIMENDPEEYILTSHHDDSLLVYIPIIPKL